MHPIEKNFTTSFSIKRLVYVDGIGSYKSIADSIGYLQPISQEQVNQIGGVYTATHLLITYPDLDIREGDEIDIGMDVYKVKGVKILNYGIHVQHSEAHLEKVVDKNT